MMTVKEYALDINKDVKVVLEKCRELGFNAKNEDDMLSEDEVIDLDNQVYNEDEYNLEDKVEEIVSNIKKMKQIDNFPFMRIKDENYRKFKN